MLLHRGRVATDSAWSAIGPQEWHYSIPVLTALMLRLIWLLHLGRVDDVDYAGDADEKTCPCNTRDVGARRGLEANNNSNMCICSAPLTMSPMAHSIVSGRCKLMLS